MFKGQGHGMMFMPKHKEEMASIQQMRVNVERDPLPPDHEEVPGEQPKGRFGYMFSNAAGIDEPDDRGEVARKIDLLGLSTGYGNTPLMGNLSAVFTYFGQFIDHDCTANTDRDQEVADHLNIARLPLTRNDRRYVIGELENLRTGRLELDSLYGSDPAGPLDRAMRKGDLMRVGTLKGGTAGTDDFDLPRVGDLVASSVVDQRDLPSKFFAKGALIKSMALLGDMRNDENLLVAQLHLAFLRFHNAVVATGKNFADAQEIARWTYQWLIMNIYLPAVCDADVLDSVVRAGAPLYQNLAPTDADYPMPLEFSVAVFRFGHSMLQQGYDYNAAMSSERLLTFFQLTGAGRLTRNGTENDNLPPEGKADWSRLTDTAQPAGAVDTSLPVDTFQLPNEEAGVQRLAIRNLRRGYVLDIPTGQNAVAALNSQLGGGTVTPLTTAELTAGNGGAVLSQVGWTETTPLWFYILREAEVQANGRHLGQLGSHVVANTLFGLIQHDPDSYWNRAGASWSPTDPVGGEVVRDFPSLLRAAGVLA